ncbi:helix-turn-helix transcriptional regulator [Clostridium thermosuccinogenes]|uniref:helix-turn-helix transcriptional regulator n=1 Tax=Clostridium thermosuccinogenes TaxID=84032 RepID=UPI000CCBE141|nr:helix-turn-helix transcriptional regulator [Pseudoclostridium thermosuccinogenes]PNT91261.1 transcriptional regulator [Pseudoclostridium thermosuccinogenes]
MVRVNRIKEYRKELGLTVRALSEKVGIAVGYISILENDTSNSTNPTKATMDKIAAALGKTVPEVFYSKDNK